MNLSPTFQTCNALRRRQNTWRPIRMDVVRTWRKYVRSQPLFAKHFLRQNNDKTMWWQSWQACQIKFCSGWSLYHLYKQNICPRLFYQRVTITNLNLYNSNALSCIRYFVYTPGCVDPMLATHSIYMAWCLYGMQSTRQEVYMAWGQHGTRSTWNEVYSTWHEVNMAWGLHDMRYT